MLDLFYTESCWYSRRLIQMWWCCLPRDVLNIACTPLWSIVKPELTSMDHGGILSRSKLICCNIQTCWICICGQGAFLLCSWKWLIILVDLSIFPLVAWWFALCGCYPEATSPMNSMNSCALWASSPSKDLPGSPSPERARSMSRQRKAGGSWPRRHGTISILCLILCVVLWDIIYGIYT